MSKCDISGYGSFQFNTAHIKAYLFYLFCDVGLGTGKPCSFATLCQVCSTEGTEKALQEEGASFCIYMLRQAGAELDSEVEVGSAWWHIAFAGGCTPRPQLQCAT